MLKTLIVDDHAIVREGLKNILAGNPGIEVATRDTGHIQRVRTRYKSLQRHQGTLYPFP